jgi:hypothetical protein
LTYNQSMNKLLTLILIHLLSTPTLANESNVYYCVMKNYSITSNSTVSNYDLFNFKFKKGDKLSFDEKFETISLEKEFNLTYAGNKDFFYARATSDDFPKSVVYSFGQFFYANPTPFGVFAVAAECEIF